MTQKTRAPVPGRWGGSLSGEELPGGGQSRRLREHRGGGEREGRGSAKKSQTKAHTGFVTPWQRPGMVSDGHHGKADSRKSGTATNPGEDRLQDKCKYCACKAHLSYLHGRRVMNSKHRFNQTFSFDCNGAGVRVESVCGRRAARETSVKGKSPF